MARRKLYIPIEVREDISSHIKERYPFVLDGYQSANEDEDSLTGDMGGVLRISKG